MATTDSDPTAEGGRAVDGEQPADDGRVTDGARPTTDGPTRAAVRDRLDRVTDPELDESIVALDYVTELDVDAESGRVSIELVLPTAWCSPAFAWMMVADARGEVESLPGVDRASVRLDEHVHGEEITRGVAAGDDFSDAFADADGDVEAVRAELDEKARLARQFDAMEALLDAGATPEQIVALECGAVAFDGADRDAVEGNEDDGGGESVGDADGDSAADADDRATVAVRGGALHLVAPAAPLRTYLEKARATGVVAGDDDRLFRTPEGEPVSPAEFDLVRRRCRLTKVNMSGQGGVCEALNESRRDALDAGAGRAD